MAQTSHLNMNYEMRKYKMIKFLAYFHRYGWIVTMLLCMKFVNPYLVVGVFCLAFSVWSLIGYKLKWKHIYCSYQNASHKKMTPESVDWTNIRKSDTIGIPVIFLIISLIMFFCFGLFLY